MLESGFASLKSRERFAWEVLRAGNLGSLRSGGGILESGELRAEILESRITIHKRSALSHPESALSPPESRFPTLAS